VLGIAGLCLLWPFFRERRIFPTLATVFFVANALFAAASWWMGRRIFPEFCRDAKIDSDLLRVVVFCLIWIPYLFISRRARATFVN
jgi:hypothetical protein